MGRRKEHSDQDVQAAIDYALASGWTLVRTGKSSHAFAKLRCPKNDPNCRNRQFCSNSIWSTPKNPQAHAKAIRRWVDNCLHGKQASEQE